MTVANKLIDLSTKISNAKNHCNESLITMGTTEASTLWEVGDRILEINNDELIDYIEGGIINLEIPYGTTIIGNSAFSNNKELENVIIVPGVETIGSSAFSNCSSLTSVTIPDSVTSIAKSAFYNCSSLTSVTIPDSVTSIGSSAFYNCSSLTSVTIPDSVTSIGNTAFADCSSLPSITIGDSVTHIGNGAFAGCSLLTSLILPKTESIISLYSNNALANTPIASGTGYIYVPSALLSTYQSATNWSAYSAQFRAIEDYPDIIGG